MHAPNPGRIGNAGIGLAKSFEVGYLKRRHRLEQRFGKQIALIEIHAEVGEPGKFVYGLHSLAYEVDAKIDAYLRDCPYDCLLRTVGFKPSIVSSSVGVTSENPIVQSPKERRAIGS